MHEELYTISKWMYILKYVSHVNKTMCQCLQVIIMAVNYYYLLLLLLNEEIKVA